MEAETFYFLLFFWFDDKIVIKRSDICMGETVPYNFNVFWNVIISLRIWIFLAKH